MNTLYEDDPFKESDFCTYIGPRTRRGQLKAAFKLQVKPKVLHNHVFLDQGGKLKSHYMVAVEKLPSRIEAIERQNGIADESRKALNEANEQHGFHLRTRDP